MLTDKLLVVDDDASQRNLIGTFLKRNGVNVHFADSGEKALELLQKQEFCMMISDVRMGGITGIETLRKARELNIQIPVLLVTAYADIRDAVSAMQDGAVNYLEKPVDLDELLKTVEQITGNSIGNEEEAFQHRELPPNVIAQSPISKKIFHEIDIIAQSDSRVLINGESGVGKEVIADTLHQWSSRSNKPIIKINCAALPEHLLESEWFGHEKGAFTGAIQTRVGRFEEAHEGTILLDEISEISLKLQAKLLRVIQDGDFQRVGSNKERKTNTRILAATNKNLEVEVDNGNFREDLFYRLNVMEIYIPPIRDRREDILPLAQHFAEEFLQGTPRFSQPVLDCFGQYNWPGNVRELRNAIERATLMARGSLILMEHLPKRIQEFYLKSSHADDPSHEAKKMEDIEREAILHSLKQNKYNRSETAKSLGISRRALTYKLQNYAKQGYQVNP